jgi:hypothetical protein
VIKVSGVRCQYSGLRSFVTGYWFLVSGHWSLAQGREHSAKRIASKHYDRICIADFQPHAPCPMPRAFRMPFLKPDT